MMTNCYLDFHGVYSYAELTFFSLHSLSWKIYWNVELQRDVPTEGVRPGVQNKTPNPTALTQVPLGGTQLPGVT